MEGDEVLNALLDSLVSEKKGIAPSDLKPLDVMKSLNLTNLFGHSEGEDQEDISEQE